MRVVVVGATGTLGPHAVRALVERGHEVTGVTTKEATRPAVEALGADPAVGDALDETSIGPVIERARPEAIVNLATRIPPGGPRRVSDMRPTNRLRREGTCNLLTAARGAGVRRYVSESMMFIYGFGQHAEPVEENREPGRGQSAGLQEVTDALVASESQIAAATAAGDIEGVSLRFGLFHGQDSAATRQMARLIAKRRFPLVGGGHAVLSWIALKDAAAAIALALESGSPQAVYNVVDDEPVCFADYAGEMARQLGARPPRKLPKWLVRPFASYAATFMDDVRLPVSNARLKRDLGWRPAFPSFRSVLAALVAGDAPARAR